MTSQCSTEASRHTICQVFRQNHVALERITFGVLGQILNLTPTTSDLQAVRLLRRWCIDIVTDTKQYVCHLDETAYHHLLTVFKEMQHHQLSSPHVVAACNMVYLYFAIYTASRVSTTLPINEHTNMIEHMADTMARLTIDLLDHDRENAGSE